MIPSSRFWRPIALSLLKPSLTNPCVSVLWNGARCVKERWGTLASERKNCTLMYGVRDPGRLKESYVTGIVAPQNAHSSYAPSIFKALQTPLTDHLSFYL